MQADHGPAKARAFAPQARPHCPEAERGVRWLLTPMTMDIDRHRLFRILAVYAVVVWFGVLVPRSLPAQCATPWLPGAPLSSPGGLIHASLTWDPDGSGPAPAVAVVGGDFRYAGGVAAGNLAVYDPVQSSWSALGAGFDAPVLSLHVDANGQLVAGGLFANSGATACRRIARWNGTSWSALGQGVRFASAGAQGRIR